MRVLVSSYPKPYIICYPSISYLPLILSLSLSIPVPRLFIYSGDVTVPLTLPRNRWLMLTVLIILSQTYGRKMQLIRRISHGSFLISQARLQVHLSLSLYSLDFNHNNLEY